MTNEEKRNIYNNIQNLYNMDFTTWQEVLAQLYNLVADIDQKFDTVKEQFELMLGKEVANKLEEMYNDGSLEKLLNTQTLERIKQELLQIITTNKTEFDNFKNEINEQLDNIEKKTLNYLTPELFGAKGDGVADDTIAFNNMLKSARENKIRCIKASGRYKINATANLTEFGVDGITIEGLHKSLTMGDGSEILLNTGGIGIDCTGTSKFVLKNIKVYSRHESLDNPSTIGILFGRSESHQVAGFCKLENAYIDIKSNYSANDGLGSIGVYDYAVEVVDFNKGEIRADVPIIFTQNNIYNIESSLTNTNPPSSANTMTVVNLIGTMLTSWRNYACICENIGESFFKINTDCYPSDGRTKGISDFLFLGDYNKNIDINNIHSECFSKLAEIDGKINFVKFSGIKSGLENKVIELLKATSAIKNCDIDILCSIDRKSYPTGATNVLYSEQTGDWNIVGNDIRLGSDNAIYCPNQKINSTRIISTETIENLNIKCKSGSSLDILCYDGKPYFNGKNSLDVTVPSATYYKLSFDNILKNIGTMWNVDNKDKLVIQQSGMYSINLSVATKNVAGNVTVNLLSNSAKKSFNTFKLNGYETFLFSPCVYLNKGDVVQIEIYQTTGENIEFIANNVLLEVAKI